MLEADASRDLSFDPPDGFPFNQGGAFIASRSGLSGGGRGQETAEDERQTREKRFFHVHLRNVLTIIIDYYNKILLIIPEPE
jgi:hypothetical protein